MTNQYLREVAPDGQVLVDMRATHRAMNRSNWFRPFLMGLTIATLISPITILFFEWYIFIVVDGLALTLSPIAETLRRIEGDPQTRPSYRDLGRPQSPVHFTAPLEQHHDRAGIGARSVSVASAEDSKTAAG